MYETLGYFSMWVESCQPVYKKCNGPTANIETTRNNAIKQFIFH